MAFALHSKLAQDTYFIGNLPLCQVLLMDNRVFPWLVLVPRRENIREITDLTQEDYLQVTEEIRTVTAKFSDLMGADKMNVAALGNLVAQLHIHVIARYEDDPAWPNPVWNCGVPTQEYSAGELHNLLEKVKQSLGF